MVVMPSPQSSGTSPAHTMAAGTIERLPPAYSPLPPSILLTTLLVLPACCSCIAACTPCCLCHPELAGSAALASLVALNWLSSSSSCQGCVLDLHEATSCLVRPSSQGCSYCFSNCSWLCLDMCSFIGASQEWQGQWVQGSKAGWVCGVQASQKDKDNGER